MSFEVDGVLLKKYPQSRRNHARGEHLLTGPLIYLQLDAMGHVHCYIELQKLRLSSDKVQLDLSGINNHCSSPLTSKRRLILYQCSCYLSVILLRVGNNHIRVIKIKRFIQINHANYLYAQCLSRKAPAGVAHS